MATLKNYGRTIWAIQTTVARSIGYDLARAPQNVRAVVIAVDAVLALLVKLMVDKGLFTDVELNTAVQALKGMSFPLLDPVPLVDPDAASAPLPVPAPLQE